MTEPPLLPRSTARLEHRSPAASAPHCADARQPHVSNFSACPVAPLSRTIVTNAIAAGPSSPLRSWPWRPAISPTIPPKSP
jgi:hypothetical protein